VKDCFVSNQMGHPVDSRGKQRYECFQRRKAGLTDADYKAKLNIEHLLSGLHAQAEDLKRATTIVEKELGPSCNVSYEDLFEFEFSDQGVALEKSFHAWSKVLSALEVPPRRDIILEYLKGVPTRNPYPLREAIFNFDEVRAELEDSPFAWMLQDGR